MKYIRMLALVLVIGAYGAILADGVQAADVVRSADIERELFVACVKSCHAGKCVDNPDRCPCSKPYPKPRSGEVIEAEKEAVSGNDDERSYWVDDQGRRNKFDNADRCPCSQGQPRPNPRPNSNPRPRQSQIPNLRPGQRPNLRPNMRPGQRPHLEPRQRPPLKPN